MEGSLGMRGKGAGQSRLKTSFKVRPSGWTLKAVQPSEASRQGIDLAKASFALKS